MELRGSGRGGDDPVLSCARRTDAPPEGLVLNTPFDPRDRPVPVLGRHLVCPDLDVHLDRVVEALTARGYLFMSDFVTRDFVEALRTESLALRATGGFRPAGVGRGSTWRHRPELRGDEVMWVDPDRPTREQRRLLEVMEALRTALNRRLYLGLTSYECHLAVYPPGTAYVRHRDQHGDSDARVLTTTLYLNPDWVPGDGGALRLFVDDSETVEVPPAGGVLGLFLSQDFEHEVLPATRERLSWTGWFRRDR